MDNKIIFALQFSCYGICLQYLEFFEWGGVLALPFSHHVLLNIFVLDKGHNYYSFIP